MIAKVLLIVTLSNTVLASHHEQEEHYQPQPYKFGYEVKDHHGEQHRHEHGDGHGNVQGSYGFTDHRGIHREVNYVADHHGFRATVKTNEPGTANQDPADVKVHSNAQLDGHHHQQHDHQQVYHHQEQNHGHQQVQYVAEGHRFRATVKNKEPGTSKQDPVHVKLHSNALTLMGRHHHYHEQQYYGNLPPTRAWIITPSTRARFLIIVALSNTVFASHHEQEEHYHPQPYKFGYEVKDHHGEQHRHEHGDGHGNVQGSYGFTDHRGIHREVQYVADGHGIQSHCQDQRTRNR
ncbi:cuticle protein 16.8 [Caerostris extrusa]|uniref:Cuticle protein 16.8 n=1 Tax=Caerostris extrusa TaxID=172846 RepID=A0AAV4T3C0_CAEEX|nr:cuticle protein 16.8 [Caerostris extrusa]